MTATVYILTIQAEDGEIIDQEVFSERPTFPIESDATLRVGNIDGGDSIPARSGADLAREFDFERDNST